MRIAYLVNTYPRPSHSFIRREILALERLGHVVHRFAVRRDRAALMDPADIAEHERTEPVLERGLLRLAASAARRLVRAPRAGLSALALALRVGAAAQARAKHLVYLVEAAHIAERCEALGIGHLHAHFGTNSATVAMLCDALGGPGFSVTVHGPEEFDRPEALSLDEKTRRARFTVAISAYGRSQLCRWANATDWPRLHVVHCGIEPDAFAAPTPVRENAARLVAIGRFVEQKGQLLLLEALARARRTHPALTLVLVGDGPMRAAVERAIAQHGLADAVRLAGWRDEAGVRAELAGATALVLPSFAEGLPVVVMEAMAAARPVVATAIAGVPELVREGETGWLVPAGDAEALADALRALAASPIERLAALGRAGRARVLERHDVDAQAARLAALFAEAARATEPRPAPPGDPSQGPVMQSRTSRVRLAALRATTPGTDRAFGLAMRVPIGLAVRAAATAATRIAPRARLDWSRER
ncbi:glycosyltransferase family 4 protein [Salinarimonas sp.]|uniref:glycosyltransferase family 4 protein n=1 Tax=Salinarimonas sp. TaxID=2766526 RepID=UPI0032D9610E